LVGGIGGDFVYRKGGQIGQKGREKENPPVQGQ